MITIPRPSHAMHEGNPAATNDAILAFLGSIEHQPQAVAATATPEFREMTC